MIKAYFDGSCAPINPGGNIGMGIVIKIDNKPEITISKKLTPDEFGYVTSNNVAEYYALILLLDWLIDKNYLNSEIIIMGDSQLVINQMFGNWKFKKGLYLHMAILAKTKINLFTKMSGKWIKREENIFADSLSK